jgi:flagellin-like hook-associated protein FlgL
MNGIAWMGGTLDLAQGRTNFSLGQSVTRLSSGLRINTAADDPSGLAIATNLQVQSQGLDAGVQAVQTATNALTVADGALSGVVGMLQRIRTLLVQGRSDILSNADRANSNAEINALMHEINTIAQNTSFNGRNLLDGSLANSLAKPALPVIPQNDTLSSGAKFLVPSLVNVQPNGKPLDFSIKVDAYDPVTGLLTVTYNIASPDPSQTLDQPYPTTTTVAAGQNYDNFWNTFGGPVPPGVSVYQINDAVGNPLFNFTFNNITAADVGQQAFVYTSGPFPAQTGSPLNVAVGDHEGNTVSISVDGVTTPSRWSPPNAQSSVPKLSRSKRPFKTRTPRRSTSTRRRARSGTSTSARPRPISPSSRSSRNSKTRCAPARTNRPPASSRFSDRASSPVRGSRC